MNKSEIKNRKSKVSGSVLILVLWVLFALTTLTVAIGSHVSATMSISSKLWRITESRALAEAGAHQALMAVSSQTNAWDGISEDSWTRDEDVFSEMVVGKGTCSVNYLTMSDSGTIVTNIGVIGEDGRININRIVDNKKLKKALENLIAIVGELDSETSKQIVSSIAASIGEDEELTDDTNSDYYEQSSSTSSDANVEMRSVAELRMIDGIDDELYSGLLPYVTVYGPGVVNLNCASVAVLTALADACDSTERNLGIYKSLASSIVDFQQAGNQFEEADSSAVYKQLNDFADLSAEERNAFRQMMGAITVRSSAFRGIASGIGEDGVRSEVSVEFVCDTKSKKFVYWHEIQ